MYDVVWHGRGETDPVLVACDGEVGLVESTVGAIPEHPRDVFEDAGLGHGYGGFFEIHFSVDVDPDGGLRGSEAVIVVVVDADGVPAAGLGFVEVDVFGSFPVFVVAVEGGFFLDL